MPALANEYVVGTPGSGAMSTAFVDATCTSSVLDNGVTYLVIGGASFRTEGGGGLDWVELETRLGTTQLSTTRWAHGFNPFNTGDPAAGWAMGMAAIVTGDGSSALNMRIRGQSEGFPDVRWGANTWAIVDLSELDLNSDYWSADSASGTSAEVTVTDDDVFSARLVLNTTVIGTEEPHIVTPWPAVLSTTAFGPSFVVMDVRELEADVEYDIGWEFLDEAAWVEGDVDGRVVFTAPETGDYLIIASCEGFSDGTQISYRRTRVIVVRLNAFTAYGAAINVGNINASAGGGTNVFESANSLTADLGTADVMVLGHTSIRGEFNWWSNYMRRQGSPDADFPANAGYMFNMQNAAPGNDTNGPLFHAIESLSGSQQWNMVVQGDDGANLYTGRTRANDGAQRSILVAFALDTGNDDVVLTPTGGTLRFVSQTPTLSAAATLTPAAGSTRFTSQAPTVAPGAVTVADGTGSARFGGQAPTLAPGAVTLVDGTGSLRLLSQPATLSTAVLLAAGVGSLRFAGQSPTLGVGAVVLAPIQSRLRFRGNAATIPGTVVAIVDTDLVVRIDTYEARVRVDSYEVKVRL